MCCVKSMIFLDLNYLREKKNENKGKYWGRKTRTL